MHCHPTVEPAPALRAPSGAELAAWLAGAAGVRDRVLTDGRHTVAYGATAALLDRLDAAFARHGIARQPLALECSQSVAGALVILQMLRRGHDVVLLPAFEASSPAAGARRLLPSFCSHVVTAGVGPAAAGTAVDDAAGPLADIGIGVNDGFVAEPLVAGFAGPDLYLRTAGSTGTPKLARMSHQKWLDNAAACVERWQLCGDDRLSVAVPIFHSYGLGAALLPGLLAGAAMDLGSGGNLRRYLEREQSFAPNVAFLAPAICDAFVGLRPSPRRYRLVVTAGDKVKRDTVAAFEPRFGPLVDLYGSAEMGAVSAASPADAAERRFGTAGYPLAGIELRVVADDPAAAADGARLGHLHCRQPNGFAGYLVGDAGWRFEPRTDDAWFATGDLARCRADGYVEIVGRAGLCARRDGFMVVFADVESALEKLPGVAHAVVVACGESNRGSRLVAVCLPATGEGAPPLAAATVRRGCFDLLPRYAVPDTVLIVDGLPQLPSGKVDRRAVRHLANAKMGAPGTAVAVGPA